MVRERILGFLKKREEKPLNNKQFAPEASQSISQLGVWSFCQKRGVFQLKLNFLGIDHRSLATKRAAIQYNAQCILQIYINASRSSFFFVCFAVPVNRHCLVFSSQSWCEQICSSSSPSLAGGSWRTNGNGGLSSSLVASKSNLFSCSEKLHIFPS